jgi:serine/threonine protein kinase
MVIISFFSLYFFFPFHLSHSSFFPSFLFVPEFFFSQSDDAPIKLADFGTAHILKDDNEDGKLRLRCGTPVYAAPELIEILINVGEKKGYGRPVDIWGVGIIMFSILGGYPPFWAEEDEMTYEKILCGDPGYIRDYWAPVSDEAKDLLRQLFTVDPMKRPTATQALQHAWFVFIFFIFSF